MSSGGRERLYWEQMGQVPSKWSVSIFSIKSYKKEREFCYKFAQICSNFAKKLYPRCQIRS